MGETDVARLPRPLPESIEISQTPDVRFSPNEMRRLKTQTGRTMSELFGEDASEEDRLQAMVWLALTRDGHHVEWDQAGDVAITFHVEPPDPTNGGP